MRELRETKKLSQGDIEKRTGLLRCYISRVENGHTVPAIETLEKLARALEIPLYQLFYEGEEPAQAAESAEEEIGGRQHVWRQRQTRGLPAQVAECLSKAVETDRKLLMLMAQKMAGGRNRRASGEA